MSIQALFEGLSSQKQWEEYQRRQSVVIEAEKAFEECVHKVNVAKTRLAAIHPETDPYAGRGAEQHKKEVDAYVTMVSKMIDIANAAYKTGDSVYMRLSHSSDENVVYRRARVTSVCYETVSSGTLTSDDKECPSAKWGTLLYPIHPSSKPSCRLPCVMDGVSAEETQKYLTLYLTMLGCKTVTFK